MDAHTESFQQFLLQAQNVVVLVGAGLSASSGVSTYEQTRGFWNNFHSIDLSTPDAFLENPGLVWQFYSARRHEVLGAKPNRAHYALAELSRRLNYGSSSKKSCLTISQNVDDLSERAGHDESRLLKLHGSLFSLKCTGFSCTYSAQNYDEPLTPELSQKHPTEVDLHMSPEQLPRCPLCGDLLRPGVVWFGESIPLKVIDKIDDFLETKKIDLVLVVGTSGDSWPAVGYVERIKHQGGKIAIFNKSLNFAEIAKDAGTCWGFEGDAAVTVPRVLEPLIGTRYRPKGQGRG